MKIVFRSRRTCLQPGRHRRLRWRQRRRLGQPSADGFETYGVTGVALVTFILLGVHDTQTQVQLLVWVFFIRAVMVVGSFVSYLANSMYT